MKGTDTGIRMTLVDAKEWTGTDCRHHRREQWSIYGGKVTPTWGRKTNSRGDDLGPYEAGWEPSSRFSLYVIDGEVDPRLGSYGGIVWPTAWSDLFEARGQGYNRTVEITDLGLSFRSAALDGASDMYADVRLS